MGKWYATRTLSIVDSERLLGLKQIIKWRNILKIKSIKYKINCDKIKVIFSILDMQINLAFKTIY